MKELKFPTQLSVWWEKWIDPYQLFHDELQWHEFDEENINDTNIKFSDLSSTKYSKEFEDDQNNGGFTQTPAIKHLFTPFGIIPLTEHSHPSKLFKFWTGHTNFSITKGLSTVMSTVPGVETLNIWTRYRFRIGIGKLFDDKVVMFDLKEAMIKYYKEQHDKANVESEINVT